MNMEWSKENTTKLIKSYHAKTIIWDPQDPEHFNKIKKQNAWMEIATEVQITVDQCKKKMENLLASLRREKMKMKKSAGAGKGSQEVYKSKWFAFKSLQFILDKNKTKPSLNTSVTAQWTMDSDMPPPCHLVEQVCEYIPSKEGSAVSPNGPRKKLKIKAENLQTKNIVEQHDNSHAEQTTHNAFGIYIAEQLRSLSPDMEILCKKVINDAIFEAEMGNLTRYSKIVNSLPNTLS